MNIATLAVLAIFLMGFRRNGKVADHEETKPPVPVDPEGNAISPQPDEQVTQGYYTPEFKWSPYKGQKKKMNTPNSINFHDSAAVEQGTYYVTDERIDPMTRMTYKGVVFKHGATKYDGTFVERFVPERYTIE